MTSNKRILITFDTNILRTIQKGEVTYCSFELGSAYNQIEAFVNSEGLADFVKLAIPRVVLEELKKQKNDSYVSDITALSQIYSRLSLMPNFNAEDIKLPNKEFDCNSHIEKLAQEYLAEKKIKIIELPKRKDIYEFFQKILTRALKSKPPFKKSNKHSDIGFKDVLIWESLLCYAGIKYFDKVIFLTADAGLSNEACKEEFENKIGKFLSFQQSTDFVIEELKSEYEEYIENRKFFVFGKSDYFISYLSKQLSEKKNIIIDGKRYTVINFKILDSCETVELEQEYDEQEDIEIEWRVINSKIEITFRKRTRDYQFVINTRTKVDDDNNINNIEFDQEFTE